VGFVVSTGIDENILDHFPPGEDTISSDSCTPPIGLMDRRSSGENIKTRHTSD
jgi:hypothetical protein